MTAMRGYVPATEQAGLGVHSLDHFVLAVPDLVPAQRFYSDFGLDVQATGNALGLKTFGHDQHWGVVIEGKRGCAGAGEGAGRASASFVARARIHHQH